MQLYFVRVTAQYESEPYVAREVLVDAESNLRAIKAVKEAMARTEKWDGEFRATATEAIPDGPEYRWGTPISRTFTLK